MSQHTGSRPGTRHLAQAIGSVFIGASALQFARRDLFQALVPARFAEHRGVIQGAMAAGLGLMGASFFSPSLRLVSRWSTTALLAGSLPAAVDQVRHPDQMAELGLPMPAVIGRIPLQVAMIAAIWRATRRS